MVDRQRVPDGPGPPLGNVHRGTGIAHASRGSLDRQTALTTLALAALAGAEAGPLLAEAVQVIHRGVGALACAIFEYLPDRRGLILRAEVGWPASAPRVISATTRMESHRARSGLDGAVVVTIAGSPLFGYLALHLEEDRRLTGDERRFVDDTTDLVAVALRRLSADGRQRHAALHDPLTGLPNRSLILEHLRLAMARSQRHPAPVAALFVDLGRFKLVNDTMGHSVGDELLVAVAERLVGVLRPSDTIGRLGGDEFLVVCEDLAGEGEALTVAHRLAGAFREPFSLRKFEVSSTASIGVALSRADADHAVLLAEADAAMYAAKRQMGTAVALYDERMQAGSGAGMPSQPVPVASSGEPAGRLEALLSRLAAMVDDLSDPDPVDLRDSWD